MIISSLLDGDKSQCILTLEDGHWLRATWRGFVDPDEARQGAENYLVHAADFHCPYLLNDNLALRGPWFDSLEWLERVWLPQARRLNLRYIAHIPQADTSTDVLTLRFPESLIGQLELQIFEDVGQAEAWLRACQQQAAWLAR